MSLYHSFTHSPQVFVHFADTRILLKNNDIPFCQSPSSRRKTDIYKVNSGFDWNHQGSTKENEKWELGGDVPMFNSTSWSCTNFSSQNLSEEASKPHLQPAPGNYLQSLGMPYSLGHRLLSPSMENLAIALLRLLPNCDFMSYRKTFRIPKSRGRSHRSSWYLQFLRN